MSRPHTALTPEGRRVREVLSYTRRGNQLTDAQSAAWERRAPDWWIPDETFDRPGFDVDAWFGREAPLVVEIGSGVGEATVALAATRPHLNLLAFEVWRPGVAQTMQRMEAAGVDNIRLVSVDAVWSTTHVLAPASVEELWTFFPDPWPKHRHRRRRLVQPAFAAEAAARLVPGGRWRLATDWADYADSMVEAMAAVPVLRGGVAERWADRPLTRFERRGLAAGRAPVDLCYTRVDG